MKKRIIVGINTSAVVLLFIGTAFAPSVYASEELVEVTVEACGISGIEPKTVKLTQQQVDELDELFDNLKIQLDEVENREETGEIFNHAIEDLDEYGFLNGFSTYKLSRLINFRYSGQRINNYDGDLEENENKFCLIIGETDNNYFENPIVHFVLKGYERIYWLLYDIVIWALENDYQIFYNFLSRFLERLDIILWYFTMYLALICIGPSTVNPISIGHRIGFGGSYIDGSGSTSHYTSDGWVYTIGLNGIISWEGSLNGQLEESIHIPMVEIYSGVAGFSGIKILQEDNHFYLGYARHVKIG